mmetsp:Transcript_28628/g.53937  ORF Transcript_28628/g.53937 Transcript_28628/m.53937 type:complete len:287 (-) Transcript_28628:323-1183(-)
MPQDAGPDRHVLRPCSLFGGQHQCRRSVRNRGRVGGSDRTAIAEGGLEMWYFIGTSRAGLFIFGHADRTLARFDFNRRQFAIKCAGRLSRLRARQRSKRIAILHLAGKLIGLRTILGKRAHKATLVIGVFQPVEEHMVDDLPMAQPRPAAHFGQHIGGVGHTLHPARNHGVGVTQCDLVKGDHGRFHARSTHLVQCGGGHILAQTCRKPGLTRGGLTLTCGKHTAHQHFIHRRKARTVERSLDRNTAQICRSHVGQCALETAHRRSGGRGNHNRFHFSSPCPSQSN